MLAAKAAEEEASDKSGEKSGGKGKKNIASHADDPIPFTQLLSKLDLGGGTENLFEITLSQVHSARPTHVGSERPRIGM